MQNQEQEILQKHLMRFLIGDVMNLPTADEILNLGGQTWTYKGQELPEANKIALQAQAMKLLESDLWRMLKERVQYDASMRALNKSQTEADLLAAKMELYLINLLEETLRKMSV